MQPSPKKHRGGFRPVNNFASEQTPHFKAPSNTQQRNTSEGTIIRQLVFKPSPNTADRDSQGPSAQSSPSFLAQRFSEIDHIGNSSSLFEDEQHPTRRIITPPPNRVRPPKPRIPRQTPREDYSNRRQAHTMVRERDPPVPSARRPSDASAPAPKAVLELVDTSATLEFGKASPLRNPLKKDTRKDEYSHLFNTTHARPELHRDPSRKPTHPSGTFNGGPASFYPKSGSQPAAPFGVPNKGDDVFEIPASQFVPRQPGHQSRPVQVAPPKKVQPTTIPPTPRAIYSTLGESNGFQPVNIPFQGFGAAPRQTVILDDLPPPKRTDDDDDTIDVDAELRNDGNRFGAPDPYSYVDQSKANENIKALLEGAFDEDEEKIPRTRGRMRKKKQQKEEDDEVSNSLAKKLKALEVKEEEEAPVEEEGDEEDDGTVEGMKVKLLPHQVDGVSWMIEKETGALKKRGKLTKGGILADDMGLGKTIQSIALILSNPRPEKDAVPENPRNKILPAVGKGTLIVAPLALIKQWESEINTKVEKSHALKVLVHHGQSRTKSPEKLKGYDVVITTYQVLQSEHSSCSGDPDGHKTACFGVHWYRLILDEAHTIKNRNAKCTKACYDVRAHYRWCLTGTPMQNNLDELQSLIKFLRIKPYDSLPEWKNSITGPMKNGRGNLAMRRLQVFLKVFMKRRTKEVLKKEGALNFGGKGKEGEKKDGFRIVARNVENIIGEFAPFEREFYNRLSNRAEERLAELMGGEKNSYIGALVLLLRLRQACNHPDLTRSNVKEDKDALTTGSKTGPQSGTQTPRRNGGGDGDLDDLADMLGGLSVQVKRCDICQRSLNKDNAASGAVRCNDCEQDHLNLSHQKKKHKKKHRKHKHKSKKTAIAEEPEPEEDTQDDEEDEDVVGPGRSKAGRQRRVIVESDEEDEGEWIVPEDEQNAEDLGQAGGTDDEDADGGGDTLGTVDSVSSAGDETKDSLDSFIEHDTDEDDEDGPVRRIRPLNLGNKKVINLVSDDEDDSETETSEADSESDSDSEEEDSVTETESDIEYDNDILTPSTKIRQLLSILEKETPEHKVIVFSQFTSMLDLIEPFLRRHDYNFTRYDGSMRNDLREASLERLRNDKRTRVLLCSLKCGSLGLNLTAASRVVIMEPFWNPFVEEQAIDRVHRLNQTVDVTVYRLSIHDSVEERILELQEAKRKLAEAAIEGGKAIGKLSMKDILNLFKREAEFDDRHDDGELDHHALFTRTRVLESPVKGGLLTGQGDAGISSVLAGTAPVRKKSKGLKPRIDDGVYGRR